QEVANQKQYYSNATATLIAIDAEIGAVNKENEGELAKHIIQQIVTAPWFKSYVAQQWQEVNLSLGQALQAVAHRQQTVPVDVDGSTNVAGSSKIEAEPNSLIITPQGIQLLVPEEDSHQPIKIERHYSTTREKIPIFIDMLNQQAITGTEAIQAYQTQLINPHLQAEQEEQFQQEQLIKPLSKITTFQPL
ncbi:9722_t:CDS:2, partial [Ambispora gerdemannii]